MTRKVWALVALGLLASCAPVTTTGMLRGTLTVPRSARIQDAVVWLEDAPEATTAARGARSVAPPRTPQPTIVTKNLRFDPRVIVLAAGDTLTFRNADRVWHGPFSVSPQGRFDLGKLAPNHASRLTFAKPGQVQVRCDIHPEMSATVFVLPNRAFVRPNASGEWQLPRLPAGDYVLRAWAPGLRELRKDVSVTRGADTVIALRW